MFHNSKIYLQFTLGLVILTLVISLHGCSRVIDRNPQVEINEIYADSLIEEINLLRRVNLDSAVAAAKSTKAICDSLQYFNGSARVLSNLGYIMIQKQAYDSAQIYFQESQKIRSRLGEPSLIAASYINFSALHFGLGQFERGVNAIQKALELYEGTSDFRGIYSCYNQLGVSYGRRSIDDTSKLYFQKALKYAEMSAHRKSILSASKNLGIAYKYIGQYDSAKFYLIKTLQEHKADSNLVGIAGLKKALAQLYFDMGNQETGLRMLRESYKEARSLDHDLYISTTLSSLKKYFLDRQQIDSAYKYLSLYNDHNKKSYKTSLAESIANAQVKFETERIQLKNKIQQQQIEKDNRTKKILLSTLIAVLIAALLVLRNIQQKRKLAEKDAELQRQKIDKLLQKHEMKIFEAMVNGQEEERHRIAEDLHDRLGSILSAIKLHFNGIEEILNKNNISRPKQVEKTHQMLDVASQEVRSISHDMLSNTLVKFGLVPALNDLSETIVTSGQLEMEIFEHGLSNRLDNKVEITIYRVVQELVANILKHAEASKITIELNVIDGQLNLIVHDDGKGFDSEKHLSIGVGLQNVRNRLSTIGGEMIIDSKPNKGTSTIIEIQLNQDHD